MPKQPFFPSLRDAMKKKQTRREVFLAQMDAVVPWDRLLALIAPTTPTPGRNHSWRSRSKSTGAMAHSAA